MFLLTSLLFLLHILVLFGKFHKNEPLLFYKYSLDKSLRFLCLTFLCASFFWWWLSLFWHPFVRSIFRVDLWGENSWHLFIWRYLYLLFFLKGVFAAYTTLSSVYFLSALWRYFPLSPDFHFCSWEAGCHSNSCSFVDHVPFWWYLRSSLVLYSAVSFNHCDVCFVLSFSLVVAALPLCVMMSLDCSNDTWAHVDVYIKSSHQILHIP